MVTLGIKCHFVGSLASGGDGQPELEELSGAHPHITHTVRIPSAHVNTQHSTPTLFRCRKDLFEFFEVNAFA